MAQIIKGSPAGVYTAITPDDDNDLARISEYLYVGSTGDLVIHDVGGEEVTFASLAVGWHPIVAKRILDAGTTASSIIACNYGV